MPLPHRAIAYAGLLALVLCDLPLPAAAEDIAFDTDGGEAWTYLKAISGRADPKACDEIVVIGPRAQARAEQHEDRFIAEIPLRAGANALVASCRKAGRERARTAPQAWQVQVPDVPKAWIRLRIDGDSVQLDANRSQRAPGSPMPITRFEWFARASNPSVLEPLEGQRTGHSLGNDDSIRVRAPPMDGEYYVRLRIEDAAGRADDSTVFFRVVNGRSAAIDQSREHAAWIDGAVLYGVVPFFFGGFEGVRERLDEIAALGATAIWISPVTATTPDDFGYGPTDHFRLRDTFGSEASFRALIEAAHAQGLKVLIDFVPNHTSDRHRYFLDAERLGRRSPYYDWFDRDASGAVTHYFDWTHLNNLNFDHPEVQNHILSAFAHWLRRYDVDGFRVDASWAVAQRAPEFWPRWREELKRIKPDVLLLAEASARDAYNFANGFDAAYDWTSQLGEWAWRDVFHDAKTVPDLDRLRQALTNDPLGFAPDALTLRFLNNNDTGVRFITRYGPAYTQLAAALTFTLPGIPLIYNGDEVGAAFEPYDEGPPLQWSDPLGLAARYRRWATLRRELPALRSTALRLVRTSDDARVLAFLRPMPQCKDEALVVMNFSSRELPVRVHWQPPARRLRDAVSGATHTVDAKRPRLELDPYAIAVLQPEACE